MEGKMVLLEEEKTVQTHQREQREIEKEYLTNANAFSSPFAWK